MCRSRSGQGHDLDQNDDEGSARQAEGAIEALRSRAGRPGPRCYRFGRYLLLINERELRRDNEVVPLRPKIFDLLSLLIENANHLVDRRTVLREVWGEGYVISDSTLHHTVFSLRRIFTDDDGILIETVRGGGYRLRAAVSALDQESRPAGQVATGPGADELEQPEVIEDISQHHQRRVARWWLCAALALVAIGSLATTLFLHLKDRPSGVDKVPSVAVLAFEDLRGDDPSLRWLPGALSELLHYDLVSSPALGSPGRPGVSMAAGIAELGDSRFLPPARLAALRRHLGADYIATGTFLAVDAEASAASPQSPAASATQEPAMVAAASDSEDDGKRGAQEAGGAQEESGQGSTLRVNVRIVDTESGRTAAVASALGTTEMLQELVAEISQALLIDLGLPRGAARPENVLAGLPESKVGLRLYFLGLERLEHQDLLVARALLQTAQDHDPASPLIHEALSATWSELGFDETAIEQARLAVDTSSGCDREVELRSRARLYLAEHRWKEAAREYAALWSFFPEKAEYGLELVPILLRQGEVDRALATLGDVRRLRSGPQVDLVEATIARHQARYEREQELAESALAAAEQLGSELLAARAGMVLARVARDLGRSEQAIESAKRASETFARLGVRKHHAESLLFLANLVWWLNDDGMQAETLYRQALASARQIGWTSGAARALTNIAEILSARGRRSEARALFEEAILLHEQTADELGLATASLGYAQLLMLGEPRQAEGRIRLALDIFSRLEVSFWEATARLYLASVFFQQGRAVEAEQEARASVRQMERLGNDGGHGAALGIWVDTLLLLGRVSDAYEALGQLQAQASKIDSERLAVVISSLLCHLRLLEGDPDAAVEPCASTVRAMEEADASVEIVEDERIWLARALLARGSPRQAMQHIEQAVARLESSEAAGPLARGLVLKARVMTAEGRCSDALLLLDDTQRLVMLNGALQCQSRLARAEALIECRRHEEAVTVLEVVHSRALAAGLVPIRLESGILLSQAETALSRPPGVDPGLSQKRLQAIADEARRLGLQAIASRAEALLVTRRPEDLSSDKGSAT